MTTTAELAVREDTAPALRVPALPELPDVDSWIRAMASIAKLADKICDTDFVPAALRGKPDAVTAAILTGRELGMPPMLALRTINMIKGTPSLSAEYKRAKVLSEGHEFKILEWDEQHCKIAARRRGDRGEPTVAEYTIGHARKAGLIRKNRDGSPGKYETDPMAMMLARATTRITGAVFTDVVNGLATTELLEAGDTDALAEGPGYLELPAAPVPEVNDLRQRAAAQTTAPPAGAGTPEPAAAAADEQPAQPAVAPEPLSGPAPQGLIGLIQKELTRLEFTERAAKLRACSLLARRPLESSKEMTGPEARDVLDILKELPDGAALNAVLDDIAATAPDEEVPGDGK